MLPITNEAIGLIILITSCLTSKYITSLLCTKWISLFDSIIQLNDDIIWRAIQLVKYYDKDSSNRQELENIVIALEGYARDHADSSVEFFMCTDNFVTDSAYYRVASTSPILFELVLRICKLEFLYGWKIHMVHIAGTRMIFQDTDGLSRGA
jgi:hypothetical protein